MSSRPTTAACVSSLTRLFFFFFFNSLVPENHSAPPDVTGYTSATDGIQVERAPAVAQRQTPKYGNAELMETGDGERGRRRSLGQFLKTSDT